MFERLVEFVDSRKAGRIAVLVSATIPKMKTGRKDKETGFYPNPFVDADGSPTVRRIVRSQIRLGRYDSMVERQTGEAHESAPLWGGAGVHLSRSIVQHTGTGAKYLAYRPESTIETRLETLDGIALTDAQIVALRDWQTPSKESDAMPWRMVALGNIVALTADGDTWLS
jgi:hypothetical protein